MLNLGFRRAKVNRRRYVRDMSRLEFRKLSRLDAPLEEVRRWHGRPGALERLLPPWIPARVLRSGGVEPGSRAEIRLGVGRLSLTWVAEHRALERGEGFRDVQLRGPFAAWDHRHLFRPADGGCEMEDRVRYELPLPGPLAKVADPLVRRRLVRVFEYRHRTLRLDLEAHARHGAAPRRILVSGATGFLGTQLVAYLRSGGHEVRRLTRSPGGAPDAVGWSPSRGEMEAGALEGVDAVVHLAGESLYGLRWTAAKKRRIRESRVRGTRLLAERLARATGPPRTLVCASGMNYYGDRGQDLCPEDTAPGEGFLPEVCRAWEAAADPAREAGCRVVHLRFGLILSPAGGALRLMLPPFRLGLGGPIGPGRQYLGWLSRDDAIGIVHHALAAPDLEGPVNATAPEPVTMGRFARTLGRALGRPALLRLPASLVRWGLGEMGDELLLSSVRVVPGRLHESGYRYRDPELEPALRFLLGRDPGDAP